MATTAETLESQLPRGFRPVADAPVFVVLATFHCTAGLNQEQAIEASCALVIAAVHQDDRPALEGVLDVYILEMVCDSDALGRWFTDRGIPNVRGTIDLEVNPLDNRGTLRVSNDHLGYSGTYLGTGGAPSLALNKDRLFAGNDTTPRLLWNETSQQYPMYALVEGRGGDLSHFLTPLENQVSVSHIGRGRVSLSPL